MVKSIIETDVYRIVFTNQGATVKSRVLKKFNDNTATTRADQPGRKQRPSAVFRRLYRTEAALRSKKVLYEAKSAMGLASTTNIPMAAPLFASLSIFEGQLPGNIKSTVVENNTPIRTCSRRGGSGSKLRAPSAPVHTVHYDTAASKLITKSAKDAKNGPFSQILEISPSAASKTISLRRWRCPPRAVHSKSGPIRQCHASARGETLRLCGRWRRFRSRERSLAIGGT